MVSCELCGSTKPPFVQAEIEKSILTLCKSCSVHGKTLKQVVIQQNTPKKAFVQNTKKDLVTEPYEAIVEDYSKRIKASREELKLTQREFAMHITEKESIVSHWETGSIEPSLETAKKLEHKLHIKLVELRTEERPTSLTKKKTEELTIGDILIQKMKR